MSKKRRKRTRNQSSSDADREKTQHNSNGRTANTTPSPADAASATPDRNAPVSNASAVPEPINAHVRASIAPVSHRDDVQVQRALEGTDSTTGDVPDQILDVLSSASPTRG